MNRREIERRARFVIAVELSVPMAQVGDGADLREDLGATPRDMADLAHALEDEFQVRLTDDDVAFARTVGTMVDLIETKLEQGAGFDRRRVGGSR